MVVEHYPWFPDEGSFNLEIWNEIKENVKKKNRMLNESQDGVKYSNRFLSPMGSYSICASDISRLF